MVKLLLFFPQFGPYALDKRISQSQLYQIQNFILYTVQMKWMLTMSCMPHGAGREKNAFQ